ncbi:diguanylate cyclase [Thalassotalea euphylliae]|uniref:diguanylate cyclase n=1 Tax=Thalassotalea euphylliae TaxID=1655234 RepID=A0A3E0TVS3_9GAMM|nr:diguanylate cyclase [Thalassotalea euphylliae]REL28688.1 diguanylate cyclase [Thalassotalea euphylliae]
MTAVPNTSTQEYTTERSFQPIWVALLLGVLGATLNTFTFPFLPEVELILGNAMVIIAAMCLKPQWALLTALMTATPLYFTWGHPFAFLTFGLEALTIAYLRGRGVYVLFADIAYWCVIGMPLTGLIVWLGVDQGTVYWLFIALKQGFNAIIYGTIGCLIAFLLSDRLNASWSQQPPLKRKLKHQLNYAIVLMTTMALTSTTLFISRDLIVKAQNIIETTLEDRSEKFAEMIDISLKNQKSAIALAAQWLSAVPASQWQTSLEQVHQSYSGFITMLITNSNADVIHASPQHLLSLSGDMNVADRDYFQQAMLTQSLYMSPVFKGRGFGTDTIVAISTPIFDVRQPTNALGIVEGSVDLSFIGRLTQAKLGAETLKVVVTDQHDNIIYAHPSLNLEPLYLFDVQRVVDSSIQDRLIVETLPNKQFAYAQSTASSGWKVYTLVDYQLTIREIEREYLVIFFSLMLTLLLTSLIAHRFGSRITRPLRFIMKQVNKYDNKAITEFTPLYQVAAIEIEQLYEELKSNKRSVKEHQQQLEIKVQERTQELNQANQQLKAQARIDGLTKVYNRHYLDSHFELMQKAAQRSDANMAVVMLDLDHFKRLNDTYGHLTGDKVLVAVAALIRQAFSRETDIVARFGGEEFVIVAPYISPVALTDKLEALRCSIAALAVTDASGNTINTSSSFGAVIAQAKFAVNIVDWVKVADACLYQAKDNGRNRVVIRDRTVADDTSS